MVIIPRWFVAVFVYGIIVAILVAAKPALMFDPDGNIKSCGTGIMYGATPFSPAIVFPILAILCYIMSCIFSLAIV